VKDDAILREKMDQLNKIVEQILDFARGTEPNLSAVNVNQLLDDLGLLTRHKMRNQGIQLARRLAPDLPLVMADATQLAQAFLNLTLNAVEAMPGGGTLAISTRSLRLPRTSPEPTHILIEFKDTGQGMPEEQRRRAFTSLLSTTKQRGTGLGPGHRGARHRNPPRQGENPLPSRQRHHLQHHGEVGACAKTISNEKRMSEISSQKYNTPRPPVAPDSIFLTVGSEVISGHDAASGPRHTD
jgi:hypothetical protein